MNAADKPAARICPACGKSCETAALEAAGCRCGQCGLELAHLDFAANGAVRGIFGWLRGVGEVIEERYQVKSLLGKGGFGAAYLVEDLRLKNKRRAIKEIPELLFDEYEINLLSRLQHPSIPDITDRFAGGGMVYLVLEFGGSRTLAGERKAQGGRIPVARLLPWLFQLCEVLAYLHSQTPPVIHRDLKPDNILLDDAGRIMLIDFGIAKEARPETMTRTIGRAATQGFSPPEQAMGTGTDERSDIYALAATFYALAVGENPPAAHERIAGKELTPPSQAGADLPPPLEAALLRALSLNVNQRQQTVAAFSAELNALAPTSPPTAPYADRTVMLGSAPGRAAVTGGAAGFKLPSRRSAAAGSAPVMAAAPPRAGQPASGKKIIAAIGGIALAFAVLASASYLFWFGDKPEDGIAAGSKPVSPGAAGDRTAAVPAAAPGPASSGPEPETPSATAPAGLSPSGRPADGKGGSALDAFNSKLKESGLSDGSGGAPAASKTDPETSKPRPPVLTEIRPAAEPASKIKKEKPGKARRAAGEEKRYSNPGGGANWLDDI